MTRDRLTILSDIRPQVTLDAVWTPEQQTAARKRILADRPVASSRRPGRARATVLAGALTLGVIALPGVAAAIGNGMQAQAFFGAYDYWFDDPLGTVDPTTADRAATAAGPDGQVFSVVTAKTTDGRVCMAPVFESSTSSRAALPDYFQDVAGSFCVDGASTAPFGPDTLGRTDSGAVWWAHAGDATTAEQRMPSGELYPVVLVEGYFFGWFPLPPGDDFDIHEDFPTITGYAADGTEVGQTLP